MGIYALIGFIIFLFLRGTNPIKSDAVEFFKDLATAITWPLAFVVGCWRIIF